ncbi:MAG: SIS domain-containing protein [Methanosphaera sp.]|nr:SIS domain-containing protein [Methanosphaera sp.]
MTDNNFAIMKLSCNEIIRHTENLKNIVTKQENSICEFSEVILNSKKNNTHIFLGGAGRSGFVAKSFAMRLMHLGFDVYVLDESVVGSLENDDVVILISKSGRIKYVDEISQSRNEIDVTLLSVCGSKDSNLYKQSNISIVIDELKNMERSQDEKNILKEEKFDENDLMVMGTAFEISALILLDSIIEKLINEVKE